MACRCATLFPTVYIQITFGNPVSLLAGGPWLTPLLVELLAGWAPCWWAPCWCVRLLADTLVGGFLAGALAAGLLADSLADGLLACALAGCLLTGALACWPPLPAS